MVGNDKKAIKGKMGNFFSFPLPFFGAYPPRPSLWGIQIIKCYIYYSPFFLTKLYLLGYPYSMLLIMNYTFLTLACCYVRCGGGVKWVGGGKEYLRDYNHLPAGNFRKENLILPKHLQFVKQGSSLDLLHSNPFSCFSEN